MLPLSEFLAFPHSVFSHGAVQYCSTCVNCENFLSEQITSSRVMVIIRDRKLRKSPFFILYLKTRPNVICIHFGSLYARKWLVWFVLFFPFSAFFGLLVLFLALFEVLIAFFTTLHSFNYIYTSCIIQESAESSLNYNFV